MSFGLLRIFTLYLLGINLVTVAIFAWDKFRAIQGGWRVRESTLLLFSALGGTPAALVSREILRHKNRKQPFGKYLLAIAILQVAAFAIFFGWRMWQSF